MPLWGANTSNELDKPKFLSDVDLNFHVRSSIGANAAASASIPGNPHPGYILPQSRNIITFTVNTPGSGYATGEYVLVSNVGTAPAIGVISANVSGAITAITPITGGSVSNTAIASGAVVTITRRMSSVTIANAGTGYVTGTAVVFSGGGALRHATGTITTDANGVISGVTLTDRGSYITTPTIQIARPISSVTISAAGTGYALGEDITFSGPNAIIPATARPVVNANGGITALNFSNRGLFVGAPDTVSINTARGTGASLVAVFAGVNAALTAVLSGTDAAVTVNYAGGLNRITYESLVALGENT